MAKKKDDGFEKFKQEFDEIIMILDARLDVVEQKISDMMKTMREVQTGVRQVDRKTDVEWNGLRGTLGDLQKKVSEISKPLKNINRNIGYKKGDNR